MTYRGVYNRRSPLALMRVAYAAQSSWKCAKDVSIYWMKMARDGTDLGEDGDDKDGMGCRTVPHSNYPMPEGMPLRERSIARRCTIENRGRCNWDEGTPWVLVRRLESDLVPILPRAHSIGGLALKPRLLFPFPPHVTLMQ